MSWYVPFRPVLDDLDPGMPYFGPPTRAYYPFTYFFPMALGGFFFTIVAGQGLCDVVHSGRVPMARPGIGPIYIIEGFVRTLRIGVVLLLVFYA